MDFNEYQKKSRETAIYPNQGDNLTYLALGISGEAGEVSEKVKKFIRDGDFAGIESLSEEQKIELAKEAGDVMWYISQIATELGISLEDLALMNIEKTHSRKHRDKLGGSGDNR